MYPKNVQKMLRQMGIKTRELDVKEVIFTFSDGTVWKFEDPQVVETTAMGQRAYQVVGNPREELSEEDVKIVMEKTGVDEKTAREALKKAKGDIAEAIMSLS
jgi:nascent polypeptide-associated complex subunit alpha